MFDEKHAMLAQKVRDLIVLRHASRSPFFLFANTSMIAKKMIAYFKEDHAAISAFLEETNIELVLAEALCQLSKTAPTWEAACTCWADISGHHF